MPMLKTFARKIQYVLGLNTGARVGTGVVLLLLLALAITALFAFTGLNSPKSDGVRIAYFHGGRTMLLYRALIDDAFEKEGVSVQLLTRGLRETEYDIVPKDYEAIKNDKLFGKARGTELLQEVADGRFEGATPGESSFIEYVTKGLPLVAVAELGHDTKDKPGHAIVFATGIEINSPEDVRGLTIASRRAGAGDAIFTKEYLRSIGLSEKDVNLVEQVDEDELNKGIVNGTFDGAFFHLMSIESNIERGAIYVHQKFTWVNPELSHALLVFHKDFVKDHPDAVEKIVRAYMKRIKYEQGLPREERLKNPGEGFQKGLQMEEDYQGMNLPQYDMPPTVSLELLSEMQDLMIKYGYIDTKTDLAPYIDNSFVEKIYKEGF